MAVCPVCSQTIDVQDKHHGTLYTCVHCRGVFFVGWDGQPENAPVHEADPEPLVMEPSPPVSAAADEPMPEPAPAYEPSAGFEMNENAFPSAADEPMPEPAPAYEPPVEEPVVEEPAMEEPAVAEEPLAGFDAPLDPFGSVAAADAAASGDFSDVAEYANSAEAAAGPLSYTVRIRGLELAETFEVLREALTDSRFGWDAEDIMGRVVGGELTLKGMNPTKASILINRIKYLPIEIDWNQEVFGGA